MTPRRLVMVPPASCGYCHRWQVDALADEDDVPFPNGLAWEVREELRRHVVEDCPAYGGTVRRG